MTGKAGLGTSVALVISMDRGCQSRSFNCLMSWVSWGPGRPRPCKLTSAMATEARDRSEHGNPPGLDWGFRMESGSSCPQLRRSRGERQASRPAAAWKAGEGRRESSWLEADLNDLSFAGPPGGPYDEAEGSRAIPWPSDLLPIESLLTTPRGLRS